MASALPEALSCDIIIVGCGPTGMILAGLLAQQNFKIVVLERYKNRYANPRAAHVDGETMRSFQQLGVGEEYWKMTRPCLKYELVDANRKLLARLQLGEVGSGWPSTSFFHQPQMEDLLHERMEELGVMVFMGMTVQAITQTEALCSVFAKPTGAELDATCTKVEAQFVVGCDGAGSFVRSVMGSVKCDLGFPSIDQLVIGFEHKDPDIEIEDLTEIYQVLDIRRPHMAARWVGPKFTRWEFARNEGESREWLESEETCWNLISPWNIQPHDGKIKRRAIYTFESSITSKWRQDRILLVCGVLQYLLADAADMSDRLEMQRTPCLRSWDRAGVLVYETL